LDVCSGIMVVAATGVALFVGYETYSLKMKDKAQYLVVYCLLILTELYWLPLLLN
jgi:hypothetical protein